MRKPQCARKAEVRHVYDEGGKFLVRSYTNEYGCFHGVQPGLSLTYSPQQSCNWYTQRRVHVVTNRKYCTPV